MVQEWTVLEQLFSSTNTLWTSAAVKMDIEPSVVFGSKPKEKKMSTVGKGTVLPISDNQPRIPGSVGHVVINGVVHQGTNVGPGQVRSPDNKVHGTN